MEDKISLLIQFSPGGIDIEWLITNDFSPQKLCDAYFFLLGDQFTQILTQSVQQLQDDPAIEENVKSALSKIAQKYLGTIDRGGILNALPYPVI